MALCYELDKVTSIAYRMFPHVSLQLVETLVCAGSNLQHSSKCHQYWVRYMANTASPKVLPVCEERGVGGGVVHGCGTWVRYMPNTTSPKVVSVCKEWGGGVVHGQHCQS